MNPAVAISDAWVLRDTAVVNPELQFFCLPHAGGGASAFSSWRGKLGPRVEICAIQLPGRESRITERPLDHMEPVVANLAEALLPHIRVPYILFGHSVGALISFEVARRMRSHGHAGPRAIFVAGSRAPDRPCSAPPVYHLPDHEFLERVAGMQGIPGELMEEREILDILLPALRADFTIDDTYRFQPGNALDCSVYAFGGLDDPDVSDEDLEAWKHQTTGKFSLRMLPGNHFFLRSERATLLKFLFEDIRDCIDYSA